MHSETGATVYSCMLGAPYEELTLDCPESLASFACSVEFRQGLRIDSEAGRRCIDLAGSAGGSGPTDLEAEHALDVVVLAPLVGLVLGLRGRAGEDIDDGSIGDVPPVPSGHQHLVAFKRQPLSHFAVLHFLQVGW